MNLRAMFDFHTHILPGIDDGSRSVVESLAMLNELTRQEQAGIAATPHFYANRSSPEPSDGSAWKPILPAAGLPNPSGCEVQYFEGIHRLQELNGSAWKAQAPAVEMPLCT